ncbi:hypothetical protein VOLCADRAFT_120448 [Volvox carteri f. nagariensis]|uniref:Aprataxin C2HE/C2H2/C2HC zinc finger domain-containing protein n=1 Tax=Volvox carteri f. nagariensis TaxID=3068 RepID=D8TLN5_VOLCA|nr:uncharacterized protein VOLCADRAFT_120448 [Volvox carteri f. nagariensis]EFJ51495.1 hypothetical protein VOLCADRAFT_120448 [Volvox carteri f. nagariensis]|eukprot:XP_002947447.1 hypothetical protein VOLCADRAFT_120448 [Volvox carteri f. nagariensis]
MATLRFPSGKVVSVPHGIVKSLGRADVARYPEAVTVSRVHCTVESVICDDGQTALKLTSKGSQNPTLLVIPGKQACDLHIGQSAVLQDGAAFSLIITRPDLAIAVHMEPAQPLAGAAASTAVAGPAAGMAEAARPVLAGEAQPETSPVAPGPASAAARGQGENPADAAATSLSGHVAGQDATSSPSKAHTSDGDDKGDGLASQEGAFPSPASPAPDGTAGRKAAEENAGRKAGGKLGRAVMRGIGNGRPPSQTAPPVLLLLAGLPGSGKSTFSRELLAASPVAWVHVNQDAIRDGKPGTREQCIAAVRTALGEGACCVVDRCHQDGAQRASMRAVAAECGLAVHCVALQLPEGLCAKRVSDRTGHPGGLQGDGSKKVVFMMAGQMKKNSNWPPALSEGFASVMDCHNDADAAAAVRAWALYGSDGSGAQSTGLKLAVGSTAAAADAVGSSGSGATAPATAAAEPVAQGSATAPQGPPAATPAAAAAAVTLAVWREHVAKRKPVAAGITSFFKSAGVAGAAGRQASGSGAGAVTGATQGKPGTSGISARNGSGRNPPGASNAAVAGGATALHVAIPGRAGQGGEDQKAGNAAAGAGVKKATPPTSIRVSSQQQRTEPPADERSAKRTKRVEASAEGVGRGNRLGGGSGDLIAAASGSPPRTSKSNMTDAGGSSSQGRGRDSGKGCGNQAGRNAFTVLMASVSRQAADCNGGSGGDGGGGASKRAKHSSGADTGVELDSRFKVNAPWAQALRIIALHPEEAQQDVLHQDDKVVMIRDPFPKAKHHALVIARDPVLRTIADLRKEHLPLLAHMQRVAINWVQEVRGKDPAVVAFKLGFHAVPSMCQVHLHVVSQDFDSAALKNKKHWNSFTTAFFLPLDVVERELKSHDRLKLIDPEEQAQLEGRELRCHGCAKPMKSMPELKKHIVICDAVKHLPGI